MPDTSSAELEAPPPTSDADRARKLWSGVARALSPVRRVVGKLTHAGVDPTLPLRLAQERMRAERVFAELGQHNRSVTASFEWDLFDAGLSSVVSFFGELGKKV